MNVITNREASKAITSAIARLEFIATALQQEDLTLEDGGVIGLAAILEDVIKALELPSNHLHELDLDDTHGPGRRSRDEQAPEVTR